MRERICRNCRFFNNDPAYLEKAFRGWNALGSAYGSVRKEDGICRRLDEYLGARDWCDGFEARPDGAN